MKIVNFKIEPATAVANGADAISADAVIMNGEEYVSNEPVVFSITTGSALFSNGSSSIIILSNSLGAVSASLVNTIAETVVVEIALQRDASTHESQAATFTPSDNTVDTINLLLSIDGAKADGEDQNRVELQALSGAIPAASTAVSVGLTNGAVFINGDKTSDIKTDSAGRASLPFTSTTAGESTLTAYLSDNIAVYNSVTATFVSVSPNLALVLDVVSDNARANGSAVNRVLATVTDLNTQKPLQGQEVIFTITGGTAVFDDGSASHIVTTDSSGEVYASVKDETVESVTITAYSGDVKEKATVHFSRDYSPLQIGRVYNTNKSFQTGHPVTAWVGAELILSANGGSGKYNWNVNYPEELQPESLSGESVRMFFTDSAFPNKEYVIEVTDDVTGENSSYRFSLNVFFTEFGIDTYYDLLNHLKYPSQNELVALYNDWGRMDAYPGWLLRGNPYYWTNYAGPIQARVINMLNGKPEWAGYLGGHYYAKKIKL